MAQSLAYDANGNATSSTDFNGNKTCHAFDSARNVATATWKLCMPQMSCTCRT